MKGKISIIVPVYNVGGYIEQFVNSVISQTYQNWELILIDDGSTDNSGDICDKYMLIDHRIKVFHQTNNGVSSARNLGMDNCVGDYISFVDSDDWLEFDMYQCLIDSIENKHSDMAVCDVFRVDQKSCTRQSIKCWNECEEVYSGEGVYNIVFNHSATLWNKLFKRECVINSRFNTNLTYGEDMIFFLDVIQYINKVSIVKEAKYNYVINRSGNVVSSKLDKRSIEYVNNGIEVYKRLNSLGYNNVGFAKLYYIINSVMCKINQQKVENKEPYISTCQDAIRVPTFKEVVLYCIHKKNLKLFIMITVLRLNLSLYLKIKK